MTATAFFILLGVVFLSSLLVNALLLWIAARMLKARVKYGRTLLTVFVAQVIGLVVALVVLSDFGGPDASGRGLFCLLFFPLAFLVVKWGVRSTPGKTVAVTTIWFVLSAAVSEGAVFAFRSTLIESFSIPTGNMAPTFIGSHITVPCRKCGVNIRAGVRLSADGATLHLSVRMQQATLTCPNCQAVVSNLDSEIEDGDRIAVDKTVEPRRWDPIAFTCPWDPHTVYLHRLVGLPGETIEIVAGDVFANNRRVTRSPSVAEDMWIAVHDTADRSPSPEQFETAWKPESSRSGWQPDASGWRFSGADRETGELEFVRPITDRLAYNSLTRLRARGQHVSDVMIEGTVRSFSGAGHLGFEWNVGEYRVRARVSPSGDVRLESGGSSATGKVGHPLSGGGVLRFGFRDGQAFVGLEDRAIATLLVFPEDLVEFKALAPTVATKACSLAILASRCELFFSRITVRRDIHYKGTDLAGPCRGCTGSPVLLRAEELYVLGDNVEGSFDSRYWTEIDPRFRGRYQIGTVPAGLVLGPVRAIFWPPERWRFFGPGP